MKNLDSIDYRILNLLQNDAKSTIKEIAGQLGMTTTPVYERIRRMEEEGFIQRYVALVDKEKLDFHIIAFCNVSLKEHHRPLLEFFEKEARKLPEVVECYHIAGTFDYLLKVIVKDMAAYQDFMVNKLATLDNIGHVQSVFVMSEVKYSTSLELQ
ncbi:MAG: Lrp/AsnC family transcriptional regulator [Haliscomenobacter sp.]|jgi:DNA-binding Lrp family transcriptional regulator|nr:Lrp/AsnC family transcriptional regulator [Haliscomenobacter sp.]MBP9076799.1 Lrp/AsnC family transcriptional regulator [Haliscomenobacter sp.]MBP9873332.1 Lrp/AsnC family transcriptional regulator [Haliscomenobacter sp.]MBV6429289.1 Leucine-responsive regulatory protein [Haliscomenobacter sp.]